MKSKKVNQLPSGNLSRRNFVKSASVAAAAFTIVPRFVLGGDSMREVTHFILPALALEAKAAAI